MSVHKGVVRELIYRFARSVISRETINQLADNRHSLYFNFTVTVFLSV